MVFVEADEEHNALFARILHLACSELERQRGIVPDQHKPKRGKVTTTASAQAAASEREASRALEKRKIEEKIEKLWRAGKKDVDIGLEVGLGRDRVKQIRQYMNLVERRRKKKPS